MENQYIQQMVSLSLVDASNGCNCLVLLVQKQVNRKEITRLFKSVGLAATSEVSELDTHIVTVKQFDSVVKFEFDKDEKFICILDSYRE